MTDRRSAVLVTGATAGIGFGVVQRFVDAGWRVVAVDRDQAMLARAWASSPLVETIAADIAVPASLDAGLASCGLTSLAACVNVAGVYPPSSFLTFSEKDYRLNFDVNVLGTLLVSRAAVPYLREHPTPASIVNFASTGAYAPGDGNLVLYRASKAAIVSLTRSMAFELAPHIRVIGLAPGPIATERAASSGGNARYVDSVPLRVLGQPADMAQWVWALAGDEPLPFITGETIVVSGGALMR